MPETNHRRKNNDRLNPSVFNIPVDKFKNYYYADKYFQRARSSILKYEQDNGNPNEIHLMQVFSRHKGGEAKLCGIDEAIAILKTCSFGEIEIHALYDGDVIKPGETVMTIKGNLRDFVHLETMYLGVLARGTKIASNVWKVVRAAKEKPVLFFPARFDLWSNQERDGWAAYIGGAQGVSTDAQGSWWNARGLGTIPHALIAYFESLNKEGILDDDPTVMATKWFNKANPDVNVIALVDFHNDCVDGSLKVAKALGKKLWGVRLDTSGSLIDFSLVRKLKEENKTNAIDKLTGVNKHLVFEVRNALDENGYDWVKIIASGGFNEERVRNFINNDIPVDLFGVGSSLLEGKYDFTADIVAYGENNKSCGKVGRALQEERGRLVKIK
ncbi:MAG: quinolinate phosphoribosyl transferase [Candidatus Hodarchaeota archaeon]